MSPRITRRSTSSSPAAATTRDAGGTADVGAARITVAAGATRNGVALGRDRLRAGESRDRRRHRRRPRAPDRPHPAAPAPARPRARPRAGDDAGRSTSDRHWLPTLALALVVLLFVLANTWIDTDPDNLARAAGTIVLTTIAGGAIWCGLWALLSKTFTRQGHFGWHVRVFVIASLATLVLAALPPLIAFAFSWPWVTDFSFIAVYATVAAAIYFHLLAVEPPRVRLMRAVAIDRLRRRRRALALVQRPAHRPARRGALHEPPVPAAAAPRQARAGRSLRAGPGADAGDPRPQGARSRPAATAMRRSGGDDDE